MTVQSATAAGADGAVEAGKLKGFTLIELLVVIATMALLAGMLLPALSRARQAARSIQCLNRQRQIALGVRLYAEENEDTFPRSQHSAFAHGQLPWGRAIAGQLGGTDQTWTNLLRGLYRCPSDRRAGAWSYGQNVYYELDPASDDYAGSPQTWRRTAAVPHPAASILEAENNTAADHIMPHFWVTSADTAEVAQTRHGSRSNYAFVDGHVAALRFESTYDQARQLDGWNPGLAGARVAGWPGAP